MGDRLLPHFGDERQPHHEGRALPLTGTLGVDAATVELREVADEREADPEPAVATRASALALSQPVEDIRQDLGRDALPRIADDDLDVRSHALQLYLDPTVLRSELHGILEQIPDDLLQPSRIAADQKTRRLQDRLEPNALRLGGASDRLQRVLDEIAQVDRLDHEAHAAAHHPRHVEQIVDEPDLRIDVSDDDLHRATGLCLTELTALDERRPPLNGVERAPPLVRALGGELGLRAVGRFGGGAGSLRLAIEPRGPDGGRRW